MMEEPAKSEGQAWTILIKEWLKALGGWIGLAYVGLPLFGPPLYKFCGILEILRSPPKFLPPWA